MASGIEPEPETPRPPDFSARVPIFFHYPCLDLALTLQVVETFPHEGDLIHHRPEADQLVSRQARVRCHAEPPDASRSDVSCEERKKLLIEIECLGDPASLCGDPSCPSEG